MLNNLQPSCHASVAFGGKTLATLKESTMVSSHGSQDHFQANAKSFSSRVHAFVPSVEEEDHNQDDDDMGGGNSKGKSRDTKSSAYIEAQAQAAAKYPTPPHSGEQSYSYYDKELKKRVKKLVSEIAGLYTLSILTFA
jgi:hypothetical protein